MFNATAEFARRWTARIVLPGVFLACAILLFAQAPAIAKDEPAVPSRKQVLVYYGDETSTQAVQSENYQALLEVLRSSDKPRAAAVVESLVADAETFPLLVERDIEALKDQAVRLGFDLAIFTNAMAFEGEYQLFRAETGAAETYDLPDIPPTSSTILATSPLSRPEYLRAALLSVSALYPPDALDIVLITNSHGGRDMVLIPRVNADLSQSGAALAMREMIESDDNGAPPAWAQPQGISKLAYWKILADVSAKYGVRFPLVFRETCVSGVRSFAELFAVPGSVSLIAHSGAGNINGWELDYAKLLGTVAPGSDWIGSLAASLEDHDVHVDSWASAWLDVLIVGLRSIPIIAFFAPLLLWVVWFGLRWIYGRRQSRQAGGYQGAPHLAGSANNRRGRRSSA
ncbi:MAG: hypothetical protein R3D30_08630 [Hyphomicrobiales bacterium]